ncbi:MAG: beta-lactamase family protein [Asgard group archaeon]|nr:beta-lactamase family protein [Asgard group archaeon]
MNKMDIIGKNKSEIENRIKRIESAFPQFTVKDGIPTAIWEDEGTLLEHMKKFKVPGMSVAVINNYKLEWLKCYGIKNVETNDDVALNTLFEAGSASKAITAAVLLSLVENNDIKLNDAVNDNLLNWKIPDNQFTKDTKINLKHLLTHTSGINRPDSMFGYEDNTKPTLEQVLNGKSPAKNDPVEVQFTPGSKHQYSNFGYVIIQKYLEDIMDMSFPELMKKRLFDPLKMNNSQFGFRSKEDKDRAIVPHDQEGNARETGMHPVAHAMGGLLTTPQDLSVFLIDLMNAYNGKGTKHLTSTLAKTMLNAEIKLDPKATFGFTGQGLGMFLIESESDLFFTHPGTNMPGATCMMIANASKGQGAVIMSNSITGELVNAQLLFSIVKEYDWSLWK